MPRQIPFYTKKGIVGCHYGIPNQNGEIKNSDLCLILEKYGNILSIINQFSTTCFSRFSTNVKSKSHQIDQTQQKRR